MKVKNFVFFVSLFLSTIFFKIYAQNEVKKWSFGVSIAGAFYAPEDGKVVGGQLAYQSPRFNISRYIFKGLTLDAAFATALGDNQKYTTFDGAFRYDFGTSDNTLVPYVLVGGSLIDAVRLLPTLNFGAGGTLWISSNLGLNFQLLYKYNEERFKSQKSHIYASGGLVYRFSLGARRSKVWQRSSCFNTP